MIVNSEKLKEKDEELTENCSIITDEEEVQIPPKAPRLRAEPLKFDSLDMCPLNAFQVLYIQN